MLHQTSSLTSRDRSSPRVRWQEDQERSQNLPTFRREKRPLAASSHYTLCFESLQYTAHTEQRSASNLIEKFLDC